MLKIKHHTDMFQGITQYAEPSSAHGPSAHGPRSDRTEYVDDSQIYDYDHPEQDRGYGHHQNPNHQDSRGQHHGNGYNDHRQYDRQGKDYYPYGRNDHHGRDDEDEDMW